MFSFSKYQKVPLINIKVINQYLQIINLASKNLALVSERLNLLSKELLKLLKKEKNEIKAEDLRISIQILNKTIKDLEIIRDKNINFFERLESELLTILEYIKKEEIKQALIVLEELTNKVENKKRELHKQMKLINEIVITTYKEATKWD